MADPDEFDGDEESSDEPKPKPNWRRELEAKAKRADELAEELAKAQRELAFKSAGLDYLNDDQVEALALYHKGDITAEMLKASAGRLGWLKAESQEQQPQTVPSEPQSIIDMANAEAQAQEQELTAISQIGNAAVASAPTNQDPMTILQSGMKRAAEQGQDELVAFLRENKLLAE